MGPWIRRLRWIAIAIAVIAALALPWALSWLWWWLPMQWDTWIIVAIAANAVVVLVAAIWWVWWRLPQRQVARLSLKIRDPKARADTEDNFRKTVGQALGGAVVLIGAVAAYLQFSQQQQTATQQIIAQQTIASDQIAAQQKAAEVGRKASDDLRISNQVAKGFEQLASDKIVMRLGGIYGLEGVMNNSPEYHQPVLEALCAFVRDNTKGKTIIEEPATGHPATDIQAALTVIGRRVDGLGRVDLTHANVPGGVLFEANLRDAYPFGADLSRAEVIGADLSHAELEGADLSEADLDDAKLTGANLTGANNLTQAQLDQACGTDAMLPEGLTLKRCPEPTPVAPPLNQGGTP